MAGPRSYTLRIALISLACLLFGLGAGFGLARKFHPPCDKKAEISEVGSTSIMSRRMRAIRHALRAGRRDYEFSVGFHPILTKE